MNRSLDFKGVYFSGNNTDNNIVITAIFWNCMQSMLDTIRSWIFLLVYIAHKTSKIVIN